MAKDGSLIFQACGIMLTIKHIFDECRQYKKQKKELNISHLIGTILGPNPDNKINTVEFEGRGEFSLL